MLDLALLEVSPDPASDLYPLDLSQADTKAKLRASEPVSILAAPCQKARDRGPAVWQRGYTASDVDFEIDHTPAFYVEAPGTPGMSGAPVFSDRMAVTAASAKQSGERECFLGVYVESIESAGGLVWRAEGLRALLE